MVFEAQSHTHSERAMRGIGVNFTGTELLTRGLLLAQRLRRKNTDTEGQKIIEGTKTGCHSKLETGRRLYKPTHNYKGAGGI